MTSIDRPQEPSFKKLTNQDVEAQVDINDLRYEFPRDLNVIDSRNHVIVSSDKASASANQTVQFRLNTGSAYIHGMNSYLKMKVAASADNQTFGTGSCANLIREVVVLSASGVELDRITNYNVWHRDWCHNTFQADYLDNHLQMAGFNYLTRDVDTGAKTFILPLWHLSGIFARDKLMPAHLASGMIIQLTFETDLRALKAASGTPTFTVSDMELSIDVYNLNNVIRRKLDAISASNGLEYHYVSTHTSQYSTSAATFNGEVSRAVSRALGGWAKIQLDADIDAATEDAFVSDDGSAVSSCQWRLGALYYPNKALSDEVEMYCYSQYAFDKMRQYHAPSNVALADWDASPFTAVFGVNLEKSTVVGLSGLPLNSSRRLHFNATFASGAARTIYIFMNYMRVASCYLNSVKVSE